MIIFDTETTGLIKGGLIPLDQQPQIIEFGAIKLDDNTLEEVGRLDFLIKPKIAHLPEIITKITGIKDSDLVDAPPFSYHFPAIVKFWFGEKYSFAHNHAFDTGMMELELRRLKKRCQFPWTFRQICTVNSTYSIKNYRLKLSGLYFHLFGKEFEDAHRAIKDVEPLTKIVVRLLKDGVVKL